MKKSIYRAVNVKLIGAKEIEALVTKAAGRLVFGNDAAKDKWFGVLTNGMGEVLKTLSWDVLDDRTQVLELLAQLRARGVAIDVGIEPTGAYADAMAAQYEKAGYSVYRVSCKHTHDYAEIYDSVPSTHDAKSAAMVADLIVTRKASTLWKQPDEKQRDLRAAAKRLDWATEEHTRQGNRIEGMLARHWPELTRLIGITSATALVLLERYGCPAEVAKNSSDARALMKKTGRNFLAAEKIEAILESAAATTGLPLAEQELGLMRLLAKSARTIAEEVGDAQAVLERLSAGIESVHRMGKVVGKATAAVLFAALGDFQGYASVKSLIKATGLNLKVSSSGKHVGKLRITKRGPSAARRWLYLATLRWIQADSIARAWYQAKIARNGGLKLKGIVSLMRKLLAGLYHVARGEDLILAKLFDLRRLDLEQPQST